MYTRNFSPYRNEGFGQVDPFDKKSSFDVPHSDSANIPKNYRGIYFSQKKPEMRKRDTEEAVIRHAAPEIREKVPEAVTCERQKPAALPPPSLRCEDKCERCDNCSERPKKECGTAQRIDLEELLIAGLIIVLLREGANDMLPLELALLLL